MDSINVRYQAEALKPLAKIVYPSGTNIHKLINDLDIPEHLHDYLMVFRNGALITDYDLVIEENENLTIAVVQRGGDSGKSGILGVVSAIAIAYASPYLSPYVAQATGMSLAVATASITIVGTLIVSALIPPPSVANDTGQSNFEEPLAYNLTGQSNQANLYGGVPAIYGQIRFFPYVGAQTKVNQVGKKTVLSSLYDFGLGDILIDDVKIGTQPAENFGAKFIDHRNTNNPNLKYVNNTVAYDQLAFNLSENELVMETRPNADGMAVTMVFPRGLAKFNDKGEPKDYSVELWLEYRWKGTNTWRRASASDLKTDVIKARDKVVDKKVANYNQDFTVSGTKKIRYGNGTDSVTQDQTGKVRCNPNWFKEGTRKKLPSPVLDIDDKISSEKDARVMLYANGSPYSSWNVANQNEHTYWFGTVIPPEPLKPYEKVSSGQSCYEVNAEKTTVILTGATAQPNSVRFELFFPPPPATDPNAVMEIRIRRPSKESTNTRVLDQLQITALESLKDEKPVDLDHKHTLLEMQVQSSERLTGNVDNLSAFCSRRVRSIDNNGFVGDPIETSNPSLIALDILTSEANREPLRDDQIDFPSFVKLADFCAEEVIFEQNGKVLKHQKYEFNGLVVGSSVQEAVNNVLSNGRSQLLMLQNGKFGVLIDQPKSVPKQLITPANSWGFKATRKYPYYPDAMRVEYVDPELNWSTTEITVYSDGYNQSNAKRFETLKTAGIINYDQAYRYARYMMAQARMRSEIFSINMDIENLSVVRGDLVLVQHDVPKMGAPALRVVSVSGTTITINQDIAIPTDASYVVRTLDGDVKTGKVVSQTEANVIEIETADPDITEDALLTIGETNKVTQPYLVLSVSPAPDLTASIDLCPYHEAVYTDSALPEWNPTFNGDLISSGNWITIKNLAAVQDLTYVLRHPQVDIAIRWDFDGVTDMVKRFDVYYEIEGQEREFCGSTTEKYLVWKVAPVQQKDIVDRKGKFVVKPFNKIDFEGENAEIEFTIYGDTTPPKQVDGFGVNVVGNSAVDIFWKKSKSIDTDFYEIRYTPETRNPNWNSASLLAVLDYTENRTSASARTGTYGLIVIDTSGNKSEPQWLRTSIEFLPDQDFVYEMNDAPTWKGRKTNCNTDSGTLMLDGDYGNVTDKIGYYEFEDYYDANQIQELRCISYIQGHGVTADDYMSEWTPLASADPLASATSSEFDYWLEASTTDDQIFMSEWTPLSGDKANPLSGKGGENWAGWRRIESADLTGQLYKFRIAMVSYDPEVNVKMTSGLTEIDVLDRFESYPDTPVDVGGARIDFNPPFSNHSVPAIAVTIDGNSKDVSYEVKTKNNNYAEIYLIDNATGNYSTGKVDVQVQGYGKVRSTSL